MGTRGVIWGGSPFGSILAFHGDDGNDDDDGIDCDDDFDGGVEDDDDDKGDNLPIGWNCPGTLPLVASLRETRVTEPPWVMFVTNLVKL